MMSCSVSAICCAISHPTTDNPAANITATTPGANLAQIDCSAPRFAMADISPEAEAVSGALAVSAMGWELFIVQAYTSLSSLQHILFELLAKKLYNK